MLPGILIIHLLLLAAAIASALFGLWSVAIVDVLAFAAVAAGLRALSTKKYAVLTYAEIVQKLDAMAAEPLPQEMKPAESEAPVFAVVSDENVVAIAEAQGASLREAA